MLFQSDMWWEMGEERVQQRVDSNFGRSRSRQKLPPCNLLTAAVAWQTSFVNVVLPNHTLVGVVTANKAGYLHLFFSILTTFYHHNNFFFPFKITFWKIYTTIQTFGVSMIIIIIFFKKLILLVSKDALNDWKWH